MIDAGMEDAVKLDGIFGFRKNDSGDLVFSYQIGDAEQVDIIVPDAQDVTWIAALPAPVQQWAQMAFRYPPANEWRGDLPQE